MNRPCWSRAAGRLVGILLGVALVGGFLSTPLSAQPFAAQIQAAIRALLAGNNSWAGTNTFNNVTVTGTCTGCGGGGAPVGATYITQTANGTLTNEQALAGLASGILRGATATGVITSLGDQLPLANGGTAANLTDPGADRILFWDDTAGAITWLTPGSNLTITATTIDAVGEILTGTANQIIKTGTVLSTPQDIATTSAVQFGKLGLGAAITTPLLLDVAGAGRFTGKATSVLTGSIDPTASTSVVGVGTLFTTELVVGDRITVNAETRMVAAIASDLALTVDAAFTNTGNDLSPDKLAAILPLRTSAGLASLIVTDANELRWMPSATDYITQSVDAFGATKFTRVSNDSGKEDFVMVGRDGTFGLRGDSSFLSIMDGTGSAVYTSIAVANVYLSAGSAIRLTNKALINTAPTIASGGCTSPAVTWANGTAAFKITIGTACTGVTTVVLTLPAATNGWACHAEDNTTPASFALSAQTTSTTAVTLTNFSRTTGLAIDFVDSEVLIVKCLGG